MDPATAEPAALPLSPTAALLRGFSEPDAPVQPASLPAPATEAGPSASRQGFRIGGLPLMIRYDQGSELADLPAVHRVPHAPPWFAGMTNLHGALLPVFDLARWAGVARKPGSKPMLLVLGHGSEAAGVLIDGLPERLRVAAADWLPEAVVPAALDGCVGAAAWSGQTAWLDLDAAALLARLEAELAPPSR